MELNGPKLVNKKNGEPAQLDFKAATHNEMPMVQGKSKKAKNKSKQDTEDKELMAERLLNLRTKRSDWRLVFAGIQETRGAEMTDFECGYIAFHSSGDE